MEGTVELKWQSLHKEFKWLGDIKETWNVMDYTVVKVLHNKISNRKRDEDGYHIVYPNGKVHNEFYPTPSLALISIACLEAGAKTDAVYYMARVAAIELKD